MKAYLNGDDAEKEARAAATRHNMRAHVVYVAGYFVVADDYERSASSIWLEGQPITSIKDCEVILTVEA
jgi:hypothetical protein